MDYHFISFHFCFVLFVCSFTQSYFIVYECPTKYPIFFFVVVWLVKIFQCLFSSSFSSFFLPFLSWSMPMMHLSLSAYICIVIVHCYWFDHARLKLFRFTIIESILFNSFHLSIFFLNLKWFSYFFSFSNFLCVCVCVR